jgi:hypothetical protein
MKVSARQVAKKSNVLQLWPRNQRLVAERALTKDILNAQQRLGRRSLLSTMLYTQFVDRESDDYTVRMAKNPRKEEELISAGFEICHGAPRDQDLTKRKESKPTELGSKPSLIGTVD